MDIHGYPPLLLERRIPRDTVTNKVALEKKLNLSAVASFLSCGYILDGETWLEGVKALDNSTVLVFTKEGIKFVKYWNFIFDEGAKDLGVKHYQQTLSELILKSVKNRIRTPHKYGILLSGDTVHEEY